VPMPAQPQSCPAALPAAMQQLAQSPHHLACREACSSMLVYGFDCIQPGARKRKKDDCNHTIALTLHCPRQAALLGCCNACATSYLATFTLI
jgi:hypothetical protein